MQDLREAAEKINAVIEECPEQLRGELLWLVSERMRLNGQGYMGHLLGGAAQEYGRARPNH